MYKEEENMVNDEQLEKELASSALEFREAQMKFIRCKNAIAVKASVDVRRNEMSGANKINHLISVKLSDSNYQILRTQLNPLLFVKKFIDDYVLLEVRDHEKFKAVWDALATLCASKNEARLMQLQR
ncbi:hypothetical protein C5167_041381 [Papaver somniferum]|nr:hypothetical protein C5167_041381 [Papaver somniferum]